MLEYLRVDPVRKYVGAPRVGCSLTYLPPSHSLILFGGSKDSDIHVFDINKSQWRVQIASGKKPSPRKHHAAVFVAKSNELLIHGGEADNNRSSDEFYLLALKDWKWRKVFLLKYPSARQSHSLTAINEDVLIFGGFSLPYKKSHNDVWLLTNLQKREVNNKHEIYGCVCKHLEIKGEPPLGSKLFLSFFNSKLFVAGDTRHGPSLHSLDFKQMLWKREDTFNGLFDNLSINAFLRRGISEQMIIFGQDGNNEVNLVLSTGEMKVKSVHSAQNEGLGKANVAAGDPSNIGWFLSWGQQKSPTLMACLQRKSKKEIPLGELNVEDYLIAIKNEQILAKQLTIKNELLEELYKEMQGYISGLHQEYLREDDSDEDVERQKAKHIGQCIQLKKEYSYLQKCSSQVNSAIKALRSELGNINEDFQRCMETEFDQDG